MFTLKVTYAFFLYNEQINFDLTLMQCSDYNRFGPKLSSPMDFNIKLIWEVKRWTNCYDLRVKNVWQEHRSVWVYFQQRKGPELRQIAQYPQVLTVSLKNWNVCANRRWEKLPEAGVISKRDLIMASRPTAMKTRRHKAVIRRLSHRINKQFWGQLMASTLYWTH